MNAKKVTLIVLSIFVAISIGYLVYSETRDTQQPQSGVAGQETSSTVKEKQPLDRIVRVYYFHTTFRCPTCLKIEEYTKHAIISSFGPEINNGTVVWKVLNIEEPQNRHFVDDFKLFTKSVVLVDEQRGKQVRWKNLDKIWELVRDQSGFTDYIRSEVKQYLEGA